MTIVQGTTPDRVHAEIFAGGFGHVHVHVHETEFTAQNICLSHSSTKVRTDPVIVSMHALACALRLHGCALAMCVYFTENTAYRLRFMYMYMNFTAQNIHAW